MFGPARSRSSPAQAPGPAPGSRRMSQNKKINRKTERGQSDRQRARKSIRKITTEEEGRHPATGLSPPHRTCVAVDPNSIHTAPSLALALLWLVCEVANLSHVVRHKYTLLTFPQSMQTSTKAGAPSISAGWHTATVRSHRQWSRASAGSGTMSSSPCKYSCP